MAPDGSGAWLCLSEELKWEIPACYGPGWVATLHLVAATSNAFLLETPPPLNESTPLLPHAPRDGQLTPFKRAGLWIDLSEKVIARYREED